MKKIVVLAVALSFAACASAANVYSSDFEADDGGLAATGDWQWGSPSGFAGAPFGGPEPVGGNSGSNAWGTIIGGAHNPDTISDLTLNVDLSGAADASLTYYEYLESGGNSFDTAETYANGDLLLLADGDSGLAWREVTLDLSNYAGLTSVDIVWKFSTTGVVERVGWYIDDVTVTPEPASLLLLGLGGLALIRRR